MNPERPKILVLEALSGSAACIRAAGGDPIVINPKRLDQVDAALDNAVFYGVLLTGGGDIDPRLYGQKPHKRVYGVSETRDLAEMVVLGAARDESLPVLGICRGHQLINVEAGGTLRQHIEGHRGTSHLALSAPRSRTRKALGEAALIVSLHHQEVRKVAEGYEVSALAKDDTIEAIESKDGRVLGVQFHPEMDQHAKYSRRLFRWLVVAAAKRGGLPIPDAPGFLVPVALKGVARMTAKRAARRRKLPASVSVSWCCPQCALQFDNLKDRADHIQHLHPALFAREFARYERIAAGKRGARR